MFQIAIAAIHSTKVCNRKGKSNILSCSKSVCIAEGEKTFHRSNSHGVYTSLSDYAQLMLYQTAHSMGRIIRYFVALEPADNLES